MNIEHVQYNLKYTHIPKFSIQIQFIEEWDVIYVCWWATYLCVCVCVWILYCIQFGSLRFNFKAAYLTYSARTQAQPNMLYFIYL